MISYLLLLQCPKKGEGISFVRGFNLKLGAVSLLAVTTRSNATCWSCRSCCCCKYTIAISCSSQGSILSRMFLYGLKWNLRSGGWSDILLFWKAQADPI